MEKLIIHSTVWGPLYSRMLFDYSMPSYAQDVERLAELGVQVELIVHINDMTFVDQYQHLQIPVRYEALGSVGDPAAGFRETVRAAHEQGAYLASIAPDNVLANGCLYNAFMIARHKDMSVAVAHARVDRKAFMDMFPPRILFQSRMLVDVALQGNNTVHPCVRHAFDDHDENFTYQGLSIRALGDGVFAVVSTIATPLLLKPNASDVAYVMSHPYGMIDRGFNKKLFDEQRIKLAGSSEACFFIELTGRDDNFGGCRPGLLHNERHCDPADNVWNNTEVIWVGYDTREA